MRADKALAYGLILPATLMILALDGRITLLEPMGSHTFVPVVLGQQHVVMKVGPGVSVRPHEQVGIRLNPSRIHFFDKATQKRIAQETI